MICVPIRKKRANLLVSDFKEAQKHADIVEIWFDETENKNENFEKIFKLKKLPIIYKVTTGENLKKLEEFKIDFFDVDMGTSQKKINSIKKNNPGSKIIISFHDFKKTPPPAGLQKKLIKIKKMKADIIKIATTAKSLKDSLAMLKFLEENSKNNKLIALCMGKHGKITRAAGHLFGNYLMYAPLKEEKKTALGQTDIHKLKQIQCLLK